ncbi:hypothetical protein EB1_29970 [Empedobacter brevis NBRC 14943 = ATCC 43319]|uniref:Uncharacterized protein n=1 Tax=Empedobacter brevis NBRC 14943 = ATCC 43319 TaxID=1218108 RepID=A0A511NKH3_9FLAO|nr:hypothetical protein [Empedobacter brevis]GEM53207.1 hypothetical protein EB1_29970 [Empedobacter brevis NBRC 14943 = ATCC 43319]
MTGSGIKGLNINSEAFSDALTVVSGGITGGISSTIAGGDFWQGARQGLIISASYSAINKFISSINTTSQSQDLSLNKYDVSNDVSYFANQQELDNYINNNIGDLGTIETKIKTKILLATNENAAEYGYTLDGLQLRNLDNDAVGGTTVRFFNKDRSVAKNNSVILISPNIKGMKFSNVSATSMTINHELIHAIHIYRRHPNYHKYTEASASTYSYVYLMKHGAPKGAKYYSERYIKPVPLYYSWRRNLPNYINWGVK